MTKAQFPYSWLRKEFILLVLLGMLFLPLKGQILIKNNNNSHSSLSKNIEKQDFILERRMIHLMVVPNLSSYKEIKEKIQNDNNFKVVLNEISRSLEKKGFYVKDFIESLKISEEKYLTRKNSISDPFEVLLENAPADIFIYVDILLEEYGKDKQVNLLLVAKDKYTAERYATSSYLQSTKRHWDNFRKPAIEALNLNNEFDAFILHFETKILNLIKYGRNVDLKIETETTTSFNANVEGNITLAELIIDWIQHKTISNYQIGIHKEILRMEINIPFINQIQQVYSPTNFGLELQKFIKNILTTHHINIEEVSLRIIGNRIELRLQ